MSTEPDSPDSAEPDSEPDWKRRRRLAEIFGEELPDSTSDDREPEGAGDESANDRWLRDQVPPHHGGGRAGL